MRPPIWHMAIVLSMSFLPGLHAQLSPGDLTRSHANLEGISNCTQCHTLGEKVSNDKCLACHKEIKGLISRQAGYHASKEVRGKGCAECHSEHHGRNFDMVRFDEANFNHNLVGYELTGAHRRIDCRDCHIPDLIDEPDLKKRKETFLGLNRDCAACHDDYHQKTLSNNCASCHTTDAFAPASKFDHSRTEFTLSGKHKEVACIDCHQKETRNGKVFQVFAGVESGNCNSCHSDAHQNNLGQNCKECHTEQSFTSLARIKNFNHSQTNFQLKGAHNRINCAACHNMDALPERIFQDRLGVHANDCNTCHQDVHDAKFGANCVECHNEQSFQRVSMARFNHGLTDFTLKGKHVVVDCRKCHVESYLKPLPHNLCASCHSDYHEGQFILKNYKSDCADCHIEDGFEITSFTFEDHANTIFPLEGAHLATPCFACHQKESGAKWQFANIGIRCANCHEDVHAGYLKEKYYPAQSCEHCHSAENWEENHFNHNLTGFGLSGAHARQKCMACHRVEDESRQNKYEGFAKTSAVCASCHQDSHGGQFIKKGNTDCARCHGFENWAITNFNHDKTAFKLEGKHAEIACEACHKPVEANGKILTQYKFKSFQCVDCHK